MKLSYIIKTYNISPQSWPYNGEQTGQSCYYKRQIESSVSYSTNINYSIKIKLMIVQWTVDQIPGDSVVSSLTLSKGKYGLSFRASSKTVSACLPENSIMKWTHVGSLSSL